MLVGIDIGTSGTKALAIDTDGSILGAATVGHSLQTPQPGWSEQRAQLGFFDRRISLFEAGAEEPL